MNSEEKSYADSDLAEIYGYETKILKGRLRITLPNL